MFSGLIVIGGSYAAAQIATAARKYGYDAPIRVLSDEDTLPYQRPPLSKAFLTGGESEIRCRFVRRPSTRVSASTWSWACA